MSSENPNEGLVHKYNVERVDGKPIERGCFVLEFTDPMTWPALETYAATADRAGFHVLAEDLRGIVFSQREEQQANDALANLKGQLNEREMEKE